MSRRLLSVFVFTLVLVGGAVAPLAGQAAPEGSATLGEAEALRRYHPDVLRMLERLELAQGLALRQLAQERREVRARGSDASTMGSEPVTVAGLTALVHEKGAARDVELGEAAWAVLGPRGAEIVRRGHAFQREVLSILSDPDVPDTRAALAQAVRRYRSRPEYALPDVPKDMQVLYDHAYALGFRTGHPELDGLIWAGQWFRLAATEPLTDIEPGAERAAGLDTVLTRYFAKLSHGEPPQAFPTELPLAPAIAPGLIWLSPETAMIWDNLSMLLEVAADVLASPEVPDVRAGLEATFDHFLDPDVAVTDRDDWEIMALRHGIFFQGGYPLSVMTESERNHDMHMGAHGGSGFRPILGMPRR
jgi:hypothetical protein